MKGESKMSLGYVKGKYWVPDLRFAIYAEWDSFQALLDALRPIGLMFHTTYSYTARRYCCELATLEQFPSGQWHEIKGFDAYDENPMAAICTALRRDERITLQVRAVILEIEARLLRDRFRRQQACEDRLEGAIDDLLERLAA